LEPVELAEPTQDRVEMEQILSLRLLPQQAVAVVVITQTARLEVQAVLVE
jgi:hypothetical protein